MKKIISIVLATLMIMSVTTAFASDVTYPENLAQGCYAIPTTKVDLGTTTKIDTTGAEVAVVGEANTSFGDGTAIIDGIGMFPADLDETDTTYDNASGYKNKWRWVAKDVTVLPVFTIKFTSQVTLNRVNFTEARKIVTGYTITFKNSGTTVDTVTGTFNDASATNELYLRSISLDENITADEIVFAVTSRSNVANNGISISEMEFWADPVIATAVGAQNSTSGGVYKIFDGANMTETDGAENTTANDDRLIFEKDTPFKIEASFAKDVTLNTIKFTEFKKMIKDYEVELYKDGSKIKTHTGVFDDCTSSQKLYLRSIVLDQSYTIDKIVFKATNFGSSGTAHILEMEFYDGVIAPTVTTTGKLEIIKGDANTLFDGIYDSDGTVSDGVLQIRAHDANTNENLLNDLTITFDLGSEKTFNYAELAERRCVLGEIDVQYKNASGAWETAGTIPAREYSNSLHEIIRSVSFDSVTARYVRFCAKEIAEYSVFNTASAMRTININEIALCNYDSTEAAEATIYPIRNYGEAVSSLSANTETVNSNVMLKNNGSSEKIYRVLAAQYSAAGVLENVKLQDVPVSAGSSVIASTILPINRTDDVTKKRVLYMVWDRTTLAPYCPAVGVPSQN